MTDGLGPITQAPLRGSSMPDTNMITNYVAYKTRP